MKRKLGTSNIEVTPITLGAWALGGAMWGGNEVKDSIAAIQASIDNDITSIDTAPIYGYGFSEELVGKAIKNYDRSKLQILTKFGMRWNSDKGFFFFNGEDNKGNKTKVYLYAGDIIEEVEDSLKRLQTDYIDLIQLHWPDPTTPIEETMKAMGKLLEEGKVKAVGVCNYSEEQMKEVEKSIRLHSNQVPYSILKRDIEKDVVPYALENNVSVIAYSPLERGLLTGKYNSTKNLSEKDHRNNYFKNFDMNTVQKTIKRLTEVAQNYNCSLAQLVLAWTINQPSIVAALAGARNAKQAEENAKALQINLTNEDLKNISYLP